MSNDIQPQRVPLTADNLTVDDIKKGIEIVQHMASKPVVTLLAETIRELGGSATLQKKIINTMEFNTCSMVVQELGNEYDDIKINVSLSIAEPGFKPAVAVPTMEHARDLYETYKKFRDVAFTYWKYWREQNHSLYKKIKTAFPNHNFDTLTVDVECPTAMYFIPNMNKILSIFTFMVDRDCNIFVPNDK